MTISNTSTKNVYSGNGVATVFAFTFPIAAETELEVYLLESGFLTLKTLNTDYTIAGVGNPSGGNVTFVTPPPTVTGGSDIVLVRKTPLTQLADYIEGDSFPAETHEAALDKLTKIAQEHAEALDRAAQLPINSSEDAETLSQAILLVANNNTNINTVASDIANVNIVATNIADVSAVAANEANINAAVADLPSLSAKVSKAGDAMTGLLNLAAGADIASAATLPLINDGNYFNVTGTTTITAFASLGVGTWIGLHFDGALILTHHATDLILPSGENITTAAGDEAVFVEYASGDWRCVSYTRANGYPIKIVGTVSESGGVPTGAIIEQGSNANGEYVKYADGTMICTKALSFSSSGSAFGALYGSGEVSNTFAATFNAAPKISTGGDGGQGSGAALFFATRSAATTSVNVRAVSTSSIATTVTGHLIAIGRWFA